MLNENKIVVAVKGIVIREGKVLILKRANDDEIGAGTWNEANKYSSILMMKFSFIVLLTTAISLILVGKSYVDITIVTMISTISTIALLFIMIILTEKHLKNMSEI